MTCQACGHEIAGNAIVCYRCGAPTAVAPPVRPPAGRGTSTRWGRAWVVVVLGVLVAAAALAVSRAWHLL